MSEHTPPLGVFIARSLVLAMVNLYTTFEQPSFSPVPNIGRMAHNLKIGMFRVIQAHWSFHLLIEHIGLPIYFHNDYVPTLHHFPDVTSYW